MIDTIRKSIGIIMMLMAVHFAYQDIYSSDYKAWRGIAMMVFGIFGYFLIDYKRDSNYSE